MTKSLTPPRLSKYQLVHHCRDIIQKKSETSLYNVLRKNKNGKYEFHSTHDFDKLG